MKNTIIVTGASRGIGFAILEKYASMGWNLAFCSKNKESLEKAKNLLNDKFPEIDILAEVVDMSDQSAVLAFGKKCIEKNGKIEVLVNNAGVYTPGTISNRDFSDDLEHLMKVNLYSAYWLGKEIIPYMISNHSGHIFNISSIAGLQAYPNGGSYAITKFALQGYTRTLREELKSKNIKVTGVYPGAVLTDSWSGTNLPSERFIDPKDIAELIYTSSQLSIGACIEDIVIRPQFGDI